MTPDLAIRPVAERARAHQIVVLAATEPVLNLLLRRCQKITWQVECSERHKDP
jgi:post-segregation antitoxin (ccd killing protein)